MCVTVCEYTFTVNVDMPGDGSVNAPLIVTLREDGVTYYDVGHASWKFNCSQFSILRNDWSAYIGVSAGTYPTENECVMPTVNERNEKVIVPRTVGGKYQSPDDSHPIEVTKTWYLTKDAFLNGILCCQDKKLASENKTLKYNPFFNNCVNAVVEVGAAAGIQVPQSSYGVFVFAMYTMDLSLTAYNLGKDLQALNTGGME